MTSINEKLERVRKPRVHIKYEVETENGTVEKELPFVVGVLGDFSGHGSKLLKPFKERSFTKIDKDNFNEVMAHQQARLKFKVENALKNDGSELAVELKFRCLEDFEPTQIVQQVPELKALKETRDKLRDLLSKSDCSDRLELLLEEVLNDPKKLQLLSDELKIRGSDSRDHQNNNIEGKK